MEETAIKDEKNIDITFYTDNCSGQNKNRYLFALYSYAVSKLNHINTITHKYLIRGHTQNDADNIHSVIEKQISRYKKAAAIYVPDHNVTLIRRAKKTGHLYNVSEMSHSDFCDLGDLTMQMGMKVTYKSDDGNVVKTSDIKVFEVHKNNPGFFFYKTSYAEDNFLSVSMFSRRVSVNPDNIVVNKVNKKKLGITESKRKGILSLVEKNLVPTFYADFYKNL